MTDEQKTRCESCGAPYRASLRCDYCKTLHPDFAAYHARPSMIFESTCLDPDTEERLKNLGAIVIQRRFATSSRK